MLQGYVAGRVKAERVVEAVAAAYYGARGSGLGARLQPLIEVIERAHPGVVELAASGDGPGFAVRIAERPFPKQYEAELRRAVEQLLAGGFLDPHTEARVPSPDPRFWSRLYTTVRRFFTAST